MKPLIACIGLAVVAALIVGVGGPSTTAAQPDSGPTLVAVGPDDATQLWPYTSRSKAFEGRTLVVTTVVNEDPRTVRALLERRTGSDWEQESGGNASSAIGETAADYSWSRAHGAMRYSYAERDGDGQWLPQRYQLHTGTYLGTRHHVRAYAPTADTEWTALQAHTEYWDWFRLRHTVTDVRGTGEMVAAEFRSRDGVTVDRHHRTDGGPLSRGIVVVGTVAPLLVGFTTTSRWHRLATRLPTDASPRALAPFALALGTPLAVRVSGIAAETFVAGVTPKLFVAALYPCLVIGLPMAVARSSADLQPRVAAVGAAVGIATAFAVDFALLGIVPPDRLVGHRSVLVAALGLLAASGGDYRSAPGVAGLSLWLSGIAAPLAAIV